MKEKTKKEMRTYLSAFMYIVVFTAAVTTATLVFHEFGHLFAGEIAGCENGRITLLDESFDTYTQFKCENASDQTMGLLMLSGLLFVVPFVVLLWLLGGYEKYHAFIVLGFNFIISMADFSFFSSLAAYTAVIAGLVLIVYGENLLVDRYIFHIEKVPFFRYKYMAR